MTSDRLPLDRNSINCHTDFEVKVTRFQGQHRCATLCIFNQSSHTENVHKNDDSLEKLFSNSHLSFWWQGYFSCLKTERKTRMRWTLKNCINVEFYFNLGRKSVEEANAISEYLRNKKNTCKAFECIKYFPCICA